MRGTDLQQSGLFSYVSLESRVPQSHPLRDIEELLDEALSGMSRDFDRQTRYMCGTFSRENREIP